jgi:hypothetical protein
MIFFILLSILVILFDIEKIKYHILLLYYIYLEDNLTLFMYLLHTVYEIRYFLLYGILISWFFFIFN